METATKLNFVKDGVLRLPPGFRFHPTDEELIVQYLKRKVFSCPLPASIIPEFDVCKSDPWSLPGDSAQERYFFSTKEAKYPNGSRSNRATGSGYWKATGIDKQIVASKINQVVVGMKKTLVFYRGKPPTGSRTDWIMHEYRLFNHKNNPNQVCNENWVLCRIFLKKRGVKSSENHEEDVKTAIEPVNKGKGEVGPVFYDFLAKERTDLNRIPDSSSSGSSGVTEIAFHELEEHEESSSYNSFTLRSNP